ncbi:immunoglobulin lambda-1 light chain-like [Xiphophorus maculatus]|uniref:immunoglobulin lambda-1 light chain-like n=1 Tax=Xiphophorus maculatus TaxID=8083 RepID=UPI000C6CE0FB|nr:immunoglobulin lambda-1 light chain-like [Xiphophorus maculatus]
MTPGTIAWACFIFWTAGVCKCVLITQWPREIISNSRAQMHCYQNDTDYEYLYWYRQLRGGQIQLIVYLLAGNPNYEPDFKSGFEAERSQTKQWSLTVSSVQQKDEAVYLCAAKSLCSYEQAYFGAGTKLTVLAAGATATEPKTVKILLPSPHECRDQKKEKGERRKTLVCLASGFYPDHVSVFWQLNGQNVTDGVATDAAAKKNESSGTYSITSRLRLWAKTWFNPGNEFSCHITFFNGTNYNIYTASIYTNQTDKGMTREKYLKITQNAKLSYSALIVKSCLYAALVCFLVWKLQSSPRKQK